MATLDEIIASAKRDYGLSVTETNLPPFKSFLKRQMRAHPEYDLEFKPAPRAHRIYVDLLVDKSLLFAYLFRQRAVYQDGTETVLDSDEKLALLKAYPSDLPSWPDRRLACIYTRRSSACHKYGQDSLMLYVQIINEVGKDPAVVSLWGKEIQYEREISPRRKKLTLGHRLNHGL